MKNDVFSEMKVSYIDNEVVESDNTEATTDVPELENLDKDKNSEPVEKKPEIDYSKYLGVLEIPKIGLKEVL